MQTFTAPAPGSPETPGHPGNNVWTVQITVATIKRVQAMVGVNLLDVLDSKSRLLEKLSTDPILLCDVLYVICQQQAQSANVSDEQFGEALAGDVIDHATTALLQELADFFPTAKRQVLRKALTKLREVEEKALQIASAQLDSPELQRQLERLLQPAKT
jgi:hypothetical protein